MSGNEPAKSTKELVRNLFLLQSKNFSSVSILLSASKYGTFDLSDQSTKKWKNSIQPKIMKDDNLIFGYFDLEAKRLEKAAPRWL